MKILVSALVGTVALGAMVLGCAQKRTPPVAQSASPPTAAPAATLPPLATDDPAPDKEKRPRFGESVVYLDGKPVGVIRASELPLALKPRVVNLGGGYTTLRYGFVDYVRALGVDAKRIKALHLYGGSRVVVVDKAEVARIGDGIVFSFVQGDRGKPRVHWPPVKLNVNSTIDMVSNVAVYVEKEPPVLDAQGELVMPNGSAVLGKVPYAPEEQGNGTRVYVDGALVGTVKRKKLTDDMRIADKAGAAAKTEATGGEDRFSLLSYASKLRPDAKQAKSIDLVAGDDVVGRVSSDQARALSFHVPPRNRGQAVVDMPSAREPSAPPAKGGAQQARISAVQIYVTTAPPSRPVVDIDEAPEAAVRLGQGGSGSDEEL
ncbi:MAG: hypothetical protein KF795_16620 [Labilithrix sp.]|nr:hypothetical protein [Labilithrix sp.]